MPEPNKPHIIEKRIFTCSRCGYAAQVHGEAYFDFGCYNYIATFKCRDCKVLFESVISKMECWEPPEVTYNLADEEDILCLKCGTQKNYVWNKDTNGSCPKCKGHMVYEVTGQIKVHHKADQKAGKYDT